MRTNISKISRKISALCGRVKAFAYAGALALLLLVVHAHAAAQQIQPPLKNLRTFQDFIIAILGVVVKIGYPIAILFIIWAGFLFLTAQGNEEKINTAKRAFLWAVIGTLVLLGAQALGLAVKGTIESL